VFVIKLPYRFAPLAAHKHEAVARAVSVIDEHPEIAHWVISGHSLGGALAARVALAEDDAMAALVLIGTTHPREDDLSALEVPVTKVFATNDRIAPVDRIMANKARLPEDTVWVEIAGGNHSQFGHYGHQFLDGTATISREQQQSRTRAVLVGALRAAASQDASGFGRE
jgi:pimeloyl-ACP methyl ester carboxylesterase